jgi:2-hydroxymuconate-semialdehyde hydrolase
VLTNYHDIGTGEAVLMLHGSGPGVSAWANWRLPQARLKSDFRLLLPDLVGFGYTPAPKACPHPPDLARPDRQLPRRPRHRALPRGRQLVRGLDGAGAGHRTPGAGGKLVLMGSVGVPFELTAGLDACGATRPR